jgi:hypothetical protein
MPVTKGSRKPYCVSTWISVGLRLLRILSLRVPFCLRFISLVKILLLNRYMVNTGLLCSLAMTDLSKGYSQNSVKCISALVESKIKSKFDFTVNSNTIRSKTIVNKVISKAMEFTSRFVDIITLNILTNEISFIVSEYIAFYMFNLEESCIS